MLDINLRRNASRARWQSRPFSAKSNLRTPQARILAHSGIAHWKTLGGLTERQRGELITFFRA
jgi:hypothetical protein